MENITRKCGTPRMMRDLLNRIESYLLDRPTSIDTVVLLFPKDIIDPRKAGLLFTEEFREIGDLQIAQLCKGDRKVLRSFTECFPMDVERQHVEIYCIDMKIFITT